MPPQKNNKSKRKDDQITLVETPVAPTITVGGVPAPEITEEGLTY